MVWILQWYVFRELGKTFLLAAIGLTATLAMGGGVLNMIDQQVSAGQLLRIMTIVLPVAVALALPVSALFAAAVTYGRLSADNELTACRAGGINIHQLFLPAVVISLVSAAVTFASINYLIPSRIRNLDELVRADLAGIVRHQLQAPSRLPLAGDRFRIYAEDPRQAENPDLPKDSEELLLPRVAFVEMDNENWVRIGTAEGVRVRFDQLDTDPTVRAEFFGLTLFDRTRNQWSRLEHQDVEATRIPRNYRLRVKWLSLSELLHYDRHPEELPELSDGIGVLRAVAAKELFFRSLVNDFKTPDDTGQPDCEIHFGDDHAGFVLQAESMEFDAYDHRPTFQNVRVVERIGQQVRTAAAGSATVQIDRESQKAYLELLEGVTLTDPIDPSSTLTRARDRLEPVAVSDSIVDQVRRVPDSELLAGATGLASGRAFTERQTSLLERKDRLSREILGVIHSRLAFCASAFVLVILGAAFGIILRGAHVLTAFGISFVPSLFVIVAIIMGRQLAQNPGMTLAGILTIWSGIVVVAGLDAWTLTRVLKR